MTLLVILLTFTCPDGRIEQSKVTRRYPTELEQAVKEFADYNAGIGTLTKDFSGMDCTLTAVKGGHRKFKKATK